MKTIHLPKYGTSFFIWDNFYTQIYNIFSDKNAAEDLTCDFVDREATILEQRHLTPAKPMVEALFRITSEQKSKTEVLNGLINTSHVLSTLAWYSYLFKTISPVS